MNAQARLDELCGAALLERERAAAVHAVLEALESHPPPAELDALGLAWVRVERGGRLDGLELELCGLCDDEPWRSPAGPLGSRVLQRALDQLGEGKALASCAQAWTGVLARHVADRLEPALWLGGDESRLVIACGPRHAPEVLGEVDHEGYWDHAE